MQPGHRELDHRYKPQHRYICHHDTPQDWKRSLGRQVDEADFWIHDGDHGRIQDHRR